MQMIVVRPVLAIHTREMRPEILRLRRNDR
jgi:hypothetical protein